MEKIDLYGLTTHDIFIVKELIRSLKKNPLPKEPEKIDLSKFSFKKGRGATKNLKGNLSDSVINERKSYL